MATQGQPVTEQEWQQLVNAKTPLHWGEGWMEPDQMMQLLNSGNPTQEQPEMTLLDLMKLAAESEEELKLTMTMPWK